MKHPYSMAQMQLAVLCKCRLQHLQKTATFITGIYGENNTYKAIIGTDLVQDNFYAQIRGQRVETDGTRVLDNQNKNQKASYDQKRL